MPKNYLLMYSEQLATDIELLCQNLKHLQTPCSKSAKAQVVFMQISVKQITDKARVIWFQSLKLLSKNVAKRKVG